MTLEEYIARLNGLAFWKEFTFAQNRFTPSPGKELELADNLVWLDDYAFVLQLKQRADQTEDPGTERSWFRKKVVKTATRQIRDTLRFLGEHKQIRITNERGHAFDIRRAEIAEITKIVVFLGGRALPEDCWQTRYHFSRTAEFIHILAAHDYLGILEKLRVPEDIRRYFRYREQVVPRLRDPGVAEPDIMGAYLTEVDVPTPTSRQTFRHLVQASSHSTVMGLIGNLIDHIQRSEDPTALTALLQFARVPRSVWREIKLRFTLSLEAVEKKKPTLPFRLTFPATVCTFMIAPLDPHFTATSPEGEKTRDVGLQNLTYAAMYDTKVSKGVGILVSKDGDDFLIDWCLLDVPWEPDPKIDARLTAYYPFRKIKEAMINSFLFTA